jgi:diphthamide biosynthesis methyltransferase
MRPQRFGDSVNVPESSVVPISIVRNVVVNDNRDRHTHIVELYRVDASCVECLGIEHTVDLSLLCCKTCRESCESLILKITSDSICNTNARLSIALKKRIACGRWELLAQAFINLSAEVVVVVSHLWSVVWIAP